MNKTNLSKNPPQFKPVNALLYLSEQHVTYFWNIKFVSF